MVLVVAGGRSLASCTLWFEWGDTPRRAVPISSASLNWVAPPEAFALVCVAGLDGGGAGGVCDVDDAAAGGEYGKEVS